MPKWFSEIPTKTSSKKTLTLMLGSSASPPKEYTSQRSLCHSPTGKLIPIFVVSAPPSLVEASEMFTLPPETLTVIIYIFFDELSPRRYI